MFKIFGILTDWPNFSLDLVVSSPNLLPVSVVAVALLRLYFINCTIETCSFVKVTIQNIYIKYNYKIEIINIIKKINIIKIINIVKK